MEQIIITNGIITDHIDAPILQHNAVAVDNFFGFVGTHTDEYNDDWTLKNLSDRVALGRVTIPVGWKLHDNGTEFIPMSQIEKYVCGVDKIPAGYRLTNDKDGIVLMTIPELLAAGAITQEEANERYISNAQEQRKIFFSLYVDKVNAARWAAMSDEEQAIVSTYRQALCDITKQSGYPSDVIWPDVPSILQCLGRIEDINL